MHHILLFGAGKSATCLIDYLLKEAVDNNWTVTVADGNGVLAKSKTRDHPRANAIALNAEDKGERSRVIQQADIVISLLPPALHYLVALDCVAYEKNLLTASYVDDRIAALKETIHQKGLLFICEMGLDPGIDHMSALQLINSIKQKGGVITSFKSHCGGLVAPESDTNPWHYKISWNPRNVVSAGKAGAVYKEDGQIKNKSYDQLFEHCETVAFPGLSPLAAYPNRDSISYIPVYGLDTAATFIRTTLRYPSFCGAWNALIKAGLTGDTPLLTPNLPLNKWSEPITPFINRENESALRFLGLFESSLLPDNVKTSADVLQHLLETRLMMHGNDKDMIVMLHELEYSINQAGYKATSSLLVKGENNTRTAMAKTVGLPLGIAARLILQNKIALTGLHIPVHRAIYEPVLAELAANNIKFIEKEEPV